MAAGAEAGAEAEADGVSVFSDEEAWDVREEIPNDSAAALILLEHQLGRAAARRDRARGRLPPQRRLHRSSDVRITQSGPAHLASRRTPPALGGPSHGGCSASPSGRRGASGVLAPPATR
jgi:hypothetical protein